MNIWIDSYTLFSQRWLSAVSPFLFQATIVAILLLLMVRLGRRWPSPLRYSLLLLALLKFLVPPVNWIPSSVLFGSNQTVLETSMHLEQTPMTGFENKPVNQTVISNPREEIPIPSSLSSSDATTHSLSGYTESYANLIHFSTTAFLIYLFSCMFMLYWLYMEWRVLISFQTRSTEVVHGSFYISFIRIKQELEISRKITLRISDHLNTPAAFGLMNPVVMIPRSMVNSLSFQDMETVLYHELIHHRRLDAWMSGLQAVVVTLWWFNPVVWILSSELRKIREDCCDDYYLSLHTQSENYCRSLLRVANECKYPVPASPFMGFADSIHPLGNRFKRIMDDTLKRTHKLTWSYTTILCLIAVSAFSGIQNQNGIINPSSELFGKDPQSYIIGVNAVMNDPAIASEVKYVTSLNTDIRIVQPLVGIQVTSYDLFRDDKRLLLGCGDGSIRIHDIETGDILRTFEGVTNYITDCRVTPDQKRIIGISQSGIVKAWDIETGEEIYAISGSEGYIGEIAISSDGKYLITGDTIMFDRNHFRFHIYHLDTGEYIKTLRHSYAPLPNEPIATARYKVEADFLPNSKFLMTAVWSTAKLWDTETFTEVAFALKDHLGFESIFSPDGTILASRYLSLSAEGFHSIRTFYPASGQLIRSYDHHEDYIHRIVFSSDNRWLASGDQSGNVYITEVHNPANRFFYKMAANPASIKGMFFVENNNKLIIGTRKNIIIISLAGMHPTVDVPKPPSLRLIPTQPIDSVDLDNVDKLKASEDKEDLYRLSGNEVLKWIPKEGLSIFHWDGNELTEHGGSTGGTDSLSSIVTFVLDIPKYRFEGLDQYLTGMPPANWKIPDDLPQRKKMEFFHQFIKDNSLSGDWIVRIPSSDEERLQALEEIIQKQLNRKIRFDLREAELPVAVAKGKYDFKPIKDTVPDQNENEIYIFAEPEHIREGGGGGSGTLNRLLKHIGNHIHLWILDETESSDIKVSWSNSFLPFEMYADKPQNAWRFMFRKYHDQYLHNLSRQTSIEFTQEERLVPIWFVIEED